MSERRRTPQELVCVCYPEAYCFDWVKAKGFQNETLPLWIVRGKSGDGFIILGAGETECSAWADAAHRLEMGNG